MNPFECSERQISRRTISNPKAVTLSIQNKNNKGTKAIMAGRANDLNEPIEFEDLKTDFYEGLVPRWKPPIQKRRQAKSYRKSNPRRVLHGK
jgi:hypothetical protein